MKVDSSIKVLGLSLAVFFSSNSFANDDIVFPDQNEEYAITLTQEPTIIGSTFYGSTVNCSGDFSEYSARLISNGHALQIVSAQRVDCRMLVVRDFELDLNLYIDHPHQSSHEYYNNLPLANVISDPYGN
ncbi:hypothetical protein HQQ94_03615 [Shewanella sp. VB17]|uniref:hypothetical protein n=1 Tax=Shewanella sp. VB17 TaxID=2739432 RepID=UPI0015630B74|nr:hypothetical protein [Shewanella sp. VB17]NRD72343.1 hypothetical protein [Shewanella sp. VB17]